MEFKLETQDPGEYLPENVRLGALDDLLGHKVVAVVEDCVGPKARGGELLIVTETGCWIVIHPIGDDSALVVRQSQTFNAPESISDYATANQMLRAGLITKAQHDHLRAEEKRREDEKKAKRAAALRAELAKLEGSNHGQH